MRDPEKSLKLLSGIASALLVVSALIFLIFFSGKLKEAEAVMEYSAPPGFYPNELANELQRLRKDHVFLVEVAIRSKLAKSRDPKLAEVASKLGSRLNFDANIKEPTVSIRFTHRNPTTAIDVANTAATVADERLEDQQRKLTREILGQQDLEVDRRKLLDQALRVRTEANNPKRESSCGGGDPISPASYRASHEQSLRKLKELKAKRIATLGTIRAAKVTSD